MRKGRLLRVARMLENEVTDKEFSIGMWISLCGTVGCALGWAATRIPEFQRAGLKMGATTPQPKYKGKHGRTTCGFNAAMEFFDIYHRDSGYLFSAIGYPKKYETTRKDVAKRIREFVKSNGQHDRSLVV